MLTANDCRIEDLATVVAEKTDAAGYPHAESVMHEILVYDTGKVRSADRREMRSELSRCSWRKLTFTS